MQSICLRIIHVFYGNDYALWSSCVKTYLKALGVYVRLFIVNGYKNPKNPPSDPNEKKFFSFNSKDHYAITTRLSRTIKNKLMRCTVTKEVWNKLKSPYEGDDKSKQVKTQ